MAIQLIPQRRRRRRALASGPTKSIRASYKPLHSTVKIGQPLPLSSKQEASFKSNLIHRNFSKYWLSQKALKTNNYSSNFQ